MSETQTYNNNDYICVYNDEHIGLFKSNNFKIAAQKALTTISQIIGKENTININFTIIKGTTKESKHYNGSFVKLDVPNQILFEHNVNIRLPDLKHYRKETVDGKDVYFEDVNGIHYGKLLVYDFQQELTEK